MRIRIALIGLTLAAIAAAQPGPGRGRGAFGPPPGGPGGPGGPGPRLIGAEAGMPGRVVKNAPYSSDVVTETTQVLADGNKIHQTNTTKVFRDSEGRTRRENSLRSVSGLAGGGALPQMVFINDPVAGASYALNSQERTATRSNFHGAGRPGGRGPGGPPPGTAGLHPRPADGQPQQDGAVRPRRAQDPNFKSESLGQQTIEGVVATGTRTTYTIPAGKMGNEQAMQIVNETWYSQELQTVVMSRHSDPRSGDFVTRMTNVSRSEPSRTLFEVPADFKLSEASARRGAPPVAK